MLHSFLPFIKHNDKYKVNIQWLTIPHLTVWGFGTERFSGTRVLAQAKNIKNHDIPNY